MYQKGVRDMVQLMVHLDSDEDVGVEKPSYDVNTYRSTQGETRTTDLDWLPVIIMYSDGLITFAAACLAKVLSSS